MVALVDCIVGIIVKHCAHSDLDSE